MVQLQLELSLVKWDIICFSETRCRSQDIFIDDGHRLICSNSDEARSVASGVAILVHRRWIKMIKQRICVTDRVMAIDLKISHKMIRIIAVYLPHAGYDSNYFQSTLDDVERLIMEACDKRYAVVIGGDFNLSLDQGDRDRLLQDLCAEFSLDIANGTSLAENPNMWTFKTSWDNFNRLDYVLHSRSL